MIKTYCDICQKEIDYRSDGVNLDFNSYGTINFKGKNNLEEQQLCVKCATKVVNFIENMAVAEQKNAMKIMVGEE